MTRSFSWRQICFVNLFILYTKLHYLLYEKVSEGCRTKVTVQLFEDITSIIDDKCILLSFMILTYVAFLFGSVLVC